MATRELELKLAAGDSFSLPALPPEETGVASIEERSPLRLRSTYYDTEDLRLVRHGIALRYRSGDDDGPRWTLKLPDADGDGDSRAELEFQGNAGRVPERARELLLAYLRSSPLAPVTRLRTRRRRWALRGSDGTELAELADDRVSVLEEGRVVGRFRELEVEGRALDKPALARIAAVLEQAGAEAPKPVPKVVRALGPKASLPPDVSPPLRILPAEPAAHAVQAALARGVQRILTNDPGTRLGDAESLHQMRVGVRRLRSDLRTFSRLVQPACADPLSSELRWIAKLLGDVRDIDVMRIGLEASGHGIEGQLAPLFGRLDERDAVARGALHEALGSGRYVDMLEALVQASRSPSLEPAAWEPSRKALPPLAAEAWKALARRGRLLGHSDPDERFHRVRILAKRARYAAEAIAPALGPRRRQRALRFARRAAELQETLGVLQDAIVTRALIADVASLRRTDGRFNLAAGQLIERCEQRALESRLAFFEVWEKVDRPRLRDWMKQ